MQGALQAIDCVVQDQPEFCRFEFCLDDKERTSHHYAFLTQFDASEFSGKSVRLRFNICSTDAIKTVNDNKISLLFFSDTDLNRPAPADSFLRRNIFYNSDRRNICLEINIPISAKRVTVFSYTDRSVPIGWDINSASIICEDAKFDICTRGIYRQELDFSKTWSQEGNRIAVEWLGNKFFAEMPQGFDILSISQDAIDVVNDLLFGKIESNLFGRGRLLLSTSVESAGDFGRNAEFVTNGIMLCFSGGEDSTAALRLLPREITRKYHSKRAYSDYYKSDGSRIILNNTINEEMAIERVGDCVTVPNDFEKIGISVGMPHGYRDSFGYAALGILLSCHYGCNVIAFGSVMEQVFMKSGYDFTDVVNYRGSSYNRYRNLMASIGLYFSLPTGFLSEVVTNKICSLSKDRYTSVPCPNTNESGQSCGICFKCFRKTRLDGTGDILPPSPGVVYILGKRPLKSATSLMYAVQKTGYDGAELDEYMDVDLDFLTRYFGSYFPLLTPADVSPQIAQELEALGIEPMSEADEKQVKEIAKVFYPSAYSEHRAYPLSR